MLVYYSRSKRKYNVGYVSAKCFQLEERIFNTPVSLTQKLYLKELRLILRRIRELGKRKIRSY